MKELVDAVGAVAPIVAFSLFALPSYIGVLIQRGFFRGLLIIASLGVFCLGVDALIIKSGLFFEEFSYANSLGVKLFGTTPWTLALVYPPLLLAAFWLASKITRHRGRIILTTLFMTFIAVCLSPALAKLQLWQTKTSGVFYGVPIGNFIELLLIGLLGSWLLLILWGKENDVRASIAYSGLAILLFWTGVNIGVELWVPVGTGALGCLILLAILFVEKRQLKNASG